MYKHSFGVALYPPPEGSGFTAMEDKKRPLSYYIHHSPNGGERVKRQNNKGEWYCSEGLNTVK